MQDGIANDQPTVGNLAGDPSAIKESSTAEFADDVIVASRETPVIVDFWAEWCGPCKQLGPIIEKVVQEMGGAVKLVKLDIEKNPEVAQQLQVQSIPAVFAFVNGRPVDGFVGAQPESQIRSFVDRVIKTAGGAAGPSPLEQALEQAAQLVESGDLQNAGALYSQILQQQPDNVSAIAGLAKCLSSAGQTDAAKQLLDDVPQEKQNDAEISAVRAGLELADEAAEAIAQSDTLQAAVDSNPSDHQARFDLALALYALGQGEAAVEHLLTIVKKERSWNDDAARKQLVKIFEALGSEHPATVEGRQQLSSILFS
ncbi:MAG: thioredoxin [Rhodospirillaceae bacterium]|nr:thioredoxin [Rhodospirillaceae bacterium]